MTGILQWIADRLYQLWPLRIVRSGEWGVRFTLGQIEDRQLPPGWYWLVPWFQGFETCWATEDTHDLVTQSATTQDGRCICFSVNFAYRVVDAVAYFTQVTDFTDSLQGAAMRHLYDRVSRLTWPQLSDPGERAKLEKSLRDTLTTRVKRWGVEIEGVGFTDLVLSRGAYRIFGDPKWEG